MVQGLFMKGNKKFVFYLCWHILHYVWYFYLINFMNGAIFVFIYLSNLSKEKHFVTQT